MKRLLFAMSFLLLGACQDHIVVQLEKMPGWVTGRIAPSDVTATVGLYEGVFLLVAETQTNTDGSFKIKDVPPGYYTFRASAPGYGTYEDKRVLVIESTGTDLGEILLSTLPWPVSSAFPKDGETAASVGSYLIIYFQELMDRESSDDAYTIIPDVEGLIVNYGYYWDEPDYFTQMNLFGYWEYDSDYAFSLGTTVQTTYGRPLEFPLNITFHTAPFDVQLRYRSWSGNRLRTVSLRFNGTVSVDSVIANMTIQPDPGVGINLYSSGIRSTDISIYPYGSWPDTIITIILKGGIKESRGAMLGDTTLTFDPNTPCCPSY